MICLPTIVYLVVSLLTLIASFQYHNSNIISITGSFLFILLWSCLLNYVCKKSETIAWVLLLLPAVSLIVVIAIAFEVSVYNKVKNLASNLGSNLGNLYR